MWDHMLGWEYLTEDVYDGSFYDRKLLEARLNRLGEEGWELVAVTGNNTHTAYFKRRVAKRSP